MYSKIIVLFTLALISMSVLAAKSASELAKETFVFVQEHEAMLGQIAVSATKAEFKKAIDRPTTRKFEEWPRFGKDGYEKYTDCRMLLDSFKLYSAAQFQAKGRLSDTDNISKLYFSDKRSCEGLLIELRE
ncbi:hypothetical protein LG201_04275 [Methylobacillus gramineus]|uniref:hypothetical protein n=1 Tax=Methylobacillus gramineus TaxID=755169 RepID=UPI001CFFD52A|nr:hypothetical protein [Methylobacillus gramineus]MCB5184416.1 hypothetical protein [Methylobacillus gramineus]